MSQPRPREGQVRVGGHAADPLSRSRVSTFAPSLPVQGSFSTPRLPQSDDQTLKHLTPELRGMLLCPRAFCMLLQLFVNFRLGTIFYFFLFLLLFVVVVIVFLGPHLQHMEVPRLGVESELQLQAYDTAMAMLVLRLVLSCICDLHHSLWQPQILNPVSEARN